MFYVFCMMAIKILTLEDIPHLLYSERTDSLFQSVANEYDDIVMILNYIIKLLLSAPLSQVVATVGSSALI